eukprot:scaffold318336_cov12-Tisochrysis_lutea.AAC.2
MLHGALTKWQSRTLSVTGRRASTMRGPMVMLGTKRPSMTSTCTHSAPESVRGVLVWVTPVLSSDGSNPPKCGHTGCN